VVDIEPKVQGDSEDAAQGDNLEDRRVCLQEVDAIAPEEPFCDKPRLVLVDLPCRKELQLEDKLCLERMHTCWQLAPFQDLLGLECAHLAHGRLDPMLRVGEEQ
jgi:hypothetical protein